MPPCPSALRDWLKRWQQVTEKETAAIRQENWLELAACRETKGRLQSLLQLPSGRDAHYPLRLSPDLAALAAALKDAERQNLAQLAVKLEQLRQSQQDLGFAARTLKHIRHAYVLPPAPAWQSYS